MISQTLGISIFLLCQTNILVPWQTSKVSNYSVSRTLDISNSFLTPLRVRDVESQLFQDFIVKCFIVKYQKKQDVGESLTKLEIKTAFAPNISIK